MATERTMEGGPRGYRPTDGFFDEVFAPDGAPRPHAAGLVSALERLGPEQLAAAGRNRDKIFLQQGITFELTGEDGPVDRPWPLDLVPRILPASEWTHIKRGLAQRIRALNQFLDDLYHERQIVRDGIVPWALVVSRSHFARAVHGIRPPGGVYCHVAGCDLVRDADGTWKVLEDNVRTPSGISYVLENRVAMTRLCPSSSPATRSARSTTTRSCCSPRCAPSPRAPTARRRSSSGPRGRSTPPTSSMRSSRGRWASSSCRRATSSSATTSSTCARRAASSACTRSTAASTTTSSTRSSSAPTRCSACPGSCARTAPGRSRWRTRSAPGSPTTRPSTTTSRR